MVTPRLGGVKRPAVRRLPMFLQTQAAGPRDRLRDLFSGATFCDKMRHFVASRLRPRVFFGWDILGHFWDSPVANIATRA